MWNCKTTRPAISSAASTPERGNVIAFAAFAGVLLYQAGTTNNSIRGNSIFGNYNLGIDLTGAANDLQASPVITNAFGSAPALSFREN
jgi:parallel beta-helix repeat protein